LLDPAVLILRIILADGWSPVLSCIGKAAGSEEGCFGVSWENTGSVRNKKAERIAKENRK
jgi:hypothetical protein